MYLRGKVVNYRVQRSMQYIEEEIVRVIISRKCRVLRRVNSSKVNKLIVNIRQSFSLEIT